MPTHLAREIVARAAGRRELGGLAIPGGSGARRARHVPGPELSWGPRRATDGAGTAPPSLHPLLYPPPPLPGPRQAPPSAPPAPHTRQGAQLRRGSARGAAGPRGNADPASGSEAGAKSTPRTGSPKSPAVGVQFPRVAVPADPAWHGRSGIIGSRAPAPGFPLSLRSAASRRRPSLASWRSTGGPGCGVGERLGRP